MKIKRYDELEYDCLTTAHPDGITHYETKEHEKRYLLLMKEGLIIKNPVKNWSKTGIKLSEKGIKYHDLFLKELRDKHGHIWETDDEGEVDMFALSVNFHNGPRCSACEYSFCEHCEKEFNISKCDVDQT